jgi:hypothetical protein
MLGTQVKEALTSDTKINTSKKEKQGLVGGQVGIVYI